MGKPRYKNAKQEKLSTLFTSDLFRLIPSRLTHLNYGVSEIPVYINIKKEFSKTLSFKTPWDGDMYGYVRNKQNLFKLIGNDTLVKINISDWDDKFVVAFELKDGREDPVLYVSMAEIKDLLENCLRPKKL